MYEKKTKTANVTREHCSPENVAHKWQLTGVPAAGTPLNWPKDSQKHDLYLNEEGMYELLFTSQQKLAKAFRKHCCNVMFPHIRQQLTDIAIEDIKKGHQVAIENIGRQHQLAIITWKYKVCNMKIRYL